MDGIPVMLVGNKCDEESGKREVSKKTGEALQVSPKRFRFLLKKIFSLLQMTATVCIFTAAENDVKTFFLKNEFSEVAKKSKNQK